jgi:hypothetical protein
LIKIFDAKRSTLSDGGETPSPPTPGLNGSSSQNPTTGITTPNTGAERNPNKVCYNPIIVIFVGRNKHLRANRHDKERS